MTKFIICIAVIVYSVFQMPKPMSPWIPIYGVAVGLLGMFAEREARRE